MARVCGISPLRFPREGGGPVFLNARRTSLWVPAFAGKTAFGVSLAFGLEH